MRWVLLAMIRLYWRLAPSSLRARCLFQVTCSHRVYDVTKSNGLVAGLNSLRARWRQCRPGYRVEFFEGRLIVRLRNGDVVGPEDVAADALEPYRDALARAEKVVRTRLQSAG